MSYSDRMAGRPQDQARNGRGGIVATPESIERDAKAFEMRAAGKRMDEIALALGYCDGSHVHRQLKKHLERVVSPSADLYRATMLDQLDRMYRETMRVLEATHYHVNAGVVVYHGDPANPDSVQPLLDDSPVLAAVDRLLKIQERTAKLLGLDAPAKVDVQQQHITVTVKGAEDV